MFACGSYKNFDNLCSYGIGFSHIHFLNTIFDDSHLIVWSIIYSIHSLESGIAKNEYVLRVVHGHDYQAVGNVTSIFFELH